MYVMIMWIVFAVVTAIGLAVVLRPLTGVKSAVDAAGVEAPEIGIYRDQLEEVERDEARGVIGEPEAEQARLEISRRLLAATDLSEAASSRPDSSRNLATAGIMSIVVLIGLSGYLYLGSPNLPSQPHAQRVANATQNKDFLALIAQVEAQLEKNSEDVRGWLVLAPAYLRVQRFADAADAFGRAVDLTKPDAELLTAWGEAMVLAASGLITVEARLAFDRALALDPQFAKARFFKAMAAGQDGDHSEAIRIWEALLKDAPPDAAWRATVERHIAQAKAATGSGPALDKDVIDQAQEMNAEERQAMIKGMVKRLADRLEENGDDLQGWIRLIRARVVLGEKNKALQALSAATKQFASDSAALGQLNALGSQLGLESN